MIQCERLSDRMSDVALGRSAWSVEEQAHLDGCPDCQAEWRLVQATARLGDALPPLRNPEIMTAAVLGRLAGEQSAVRARRRSWILAGLAAAAVVVIAVRIPRSPSTAPSSARPTPAPVAVRPAVPSAPAPVPAVTPGEQAVSLPELDGLPDAELESILGSLDQSSTPSPALDDSAFDNLDDHELERVLGAWEG